MTKDYSDRLGARWTRGFNTLRSDVRYALTSLARDRGFGAVAIGGLALGIGTSTACSIAQQ